MAGTTWPSLTAGQIARASDVEAKFDWLEGSLVPMSAGSTTDSAHDIGTTTAYWRTIYANSMAGTSTARTVKFGTLTAATTTSNSDVSCEFAGARAIVLPRLTTTQRDALSAYNGMVVYNSTANQFQMYQNGAWTAMGGGAAVGAVTRLVSHQTAVGTTTILTVGTGVSGRLRQLMCQGQGGGGPSHQVVLDSMSSAQGASATATVLYNVPGFGNPTTTANDYILGTTTVSDFDMYFRDQMIVRVTNSGVTGTSVILYERSA